MNLLAPFRPGPGRRRLPAAYDAAVARVAELEPVAAEHDGCAEELDYASEKYAELLTQYRAEKRRADDLDKLLQAERRASQQAASRHRDELDRASRPRPKVGSEDATAATDTRVLRAQRDAERTIHESPVERTLTMPPLRTDPPAPSSAITPVLPLGTRSVAVRLVKAQPSVEASPVSGQRARDSVAAALLP